MFSKSTLEEESLGLADEVYDFICFVKWHVEEI